MSWKASCKLQSENILYWYIKLFFILYMNFRKWRNIKFQIKEVTLLNNSNFSRSKRLVIRFLGTSKYIYLKKTKEPKVLLIWNGESIYWYRDIHSGICYDQRWSVRHPRVSHGSNTGPEFIRSLPMIKRSQNQQLFGPDYVPFRLLIARYCFLLLFSKDLSPGTVERLRGVHGSGRTRCRVPHPA